MAKILADCKTAEKVSDADVLNFKNKVKPATKEMKCLTTCVAEKMGLVGLNDNWFCLVNFNRPIFIFKR